MATLLEHAISRRAIGGRTVWNGGGASTQRLSRRRRATEGLVSLPGLELASASLPKLVTQHRRPIDGLSISENISASTQKRSQRPGKTHGASSSRCQTEGEGQTQTIKNETTSTNKAPLQSKQMTPKLDDGAGGFPPKDGDGGGGGGGGGGGWGQGGFVFWALVLLVGFLRDKEIDTYTKPKKQKKRYGVA